jgi:hypothetical protein
MSELSTVAIKDGHRGHLHHHHRDINNPSPSVNPMEAERADRISRLAGLDRLASNPRHNPTSSTASVLPTQAYFDANSIPQIVRERSTVGSASATTGSVHDEEVSRTSAWGQSERSEMGDQETGDHEMDRMSEDMDVEANSSIGGFSDAGSVGVVGWGKEVSSPVAVGPGGGRKGIKAGQAGQDPKMIDGVTYDRDVVDTVGREAEVADE